VDTGETGSLDQQVCEIDADGVATYLVLSDLINWGSRPLVVRALNLGMEPASVQDEVLFLCFVVAAASFFFVRKLNNNTDFFRLTHPPQSVRMMLPHALRRYLVHPISARPRGSGGRKPISRAHGFSGDSHHLGD
jgi:hypothetical protein